MELKNAVSVCLISLFAATLVVRIARTLDSQAAGRLEPQLAAIVEELRALRSQGGPIAARRDASATIAPRDGLVVYYFHGNMRCPTCRSIESQAEDTVQEHFASQLKGGAIAWKVVNYEQPAGQPLAAKFQVQMPVVVLARVKDSQVRDWKRLDQVWAMVGDKPAFAKYVREEIDRMVAPDAKREAETKPPPPPSVSTPKTTVVPAKDAPALPLPQ